MHAILQHAFGPAEKLRYEEVPDPVPAAGQVRIAVEAAGVHLIDTAIRRGETAGPFPPPALPMTPGREVAGRVDQVGPDVDEAWLGRRVVAHLGAASGGYAERALAAAASLHDIPDHLGADAAVAMIGTGRTAMGILDIADLDAKDVVLVTAAAGGLGSLFVQAARQAGTDVVGLAGGPHKVDQVRRLGATVAVDYREPAWPGRVRDALGGRAACASWNPGRWTRRPQAGGRRWWTGPSPWPMRRPPTRRWRPAPPRARSCSSPDDARQAPGGSAASASGSGR